MSSPTASRPSPKNFAPPRRPDVDADWADLSKQFSIQPGTTYLNHGSFGIPPRPVREARRAWIDVVDANPMDCFVRELEPALRMARERLAGFVGTTAANLVYVENATYGMNVLAASLPLDAGDQIVLNPHEYGAVRRIWERAAARANAKVVDLPMPSRFESPDELVEEMLRRLPPRTKLLVVSHITSPTALILPMELLCRRVRERGVLVCVDGPHAPAQIPLDIDRLECDFYVASCHKWLAATLGSGFLYVHPQQQGMIQPLQKSWGRLLPALPQRWDEEFTWSGTRDPSIYLSVPAAIDFLESIGPDAFRERLYWLAGDAERRLRELFGTEPLGRSGSYRWYGTMAHVPLPEGDWSRLQEQLWTAHRIEIPIILFEDRWYIRVSCHLYNTTEDLALLQTALQELIVRAT